MKPRNRKMKNLENLWKALQATTDHRAAASPAELGVKPLSYSTAAKQFRVSLTTLLRDKDHLAKLPASQRPTSLEAFLAWKRPAGRATLLNPALEKLLVDRALFLADHGKPVTKKRFITQMLLYLKVCKIPNKFGVKGPGKDWWRAFLQRHPDLSHKRASKLSKARATACNEISIGQHFERWLKFNTAHPNIPPKLKFNADETGMCPDGTTTERVLGRRGKRADRPTQGERAEHVTGMFCCPAEGPPVPPMLIYKGKKQNGSFLDGTPDGWTMQMTENGWINDKAFMFWFKSVFVPWVNKIRSEMPNGQNEEAVLLLDGHSSHYSEEVLALAAQHKILLFFFPAHCTHVTVLQPLDVFAFRALKEAWAEAIICFEATYQQGPPTKAVVARILASIFDQVFTNETHRSSFRKAGLLPIDKTAINWGRVIKVADLYPKLVSEATGVPVASQHDDASDGDTSDNSGDSSDGSDEEAAEHVVSGPPSSNPQAAPHAVTAPSPVLESVPTAPAVASLLLVQSQYMIVFVPSFTILSLSVTLSF